MGIETALLAAGVALSATSAVMSGTASRNQAQAQSQLAKNQAAERQDQAVVQAENIRRSARQKQSQAAAAYGASGISIDQGTPLTVAGEINQQSENDAYMTLLTGQRAYDAGQTQADIYGAAGNAAQTQGFLNAGGSILQGVGLGMKGGWSAAAKKGS